MKPENTFRWLPLAASIVALSACNLSLGPTGGDDKSDPTPTVTPTTSGVTPTQDPNVSPTPDPNVTATPVPDLNLVLNGVVAQSVNGDGAVAENSVSVTIEDDNGESTVVTSTDDDGRYTVVINDVANSSGDASITISTSGDGYTEGSRVIANLGDGGDVNLEANIVVAPEDVEVALASLVETFFSFGQALLGGDIVVNPQGPVEQLGAEGDFPMVMVDLHKDWVSTSVAAVVASYQGFDPNDSAQIQAYPGEFIGLGSVDASANDVDLTLPTDILSLDINRVIPSVFAQVRFRDQDNQPLVLTADGVNNLSVRIALPLESYGTVIEDVNTTDAGIQVPVYGFKNRWYYVGNATLVQEDSNNPGTFDTWVGTLTTLSEATTDLELYAEIQISNVSTWMPWFAVSWPVTQSSVDMCIDQSVGFTQLPEGLLAELGVVSADTNFNGIAELSLPDGSFDWAFVNSGRLRYQGSVGSDGQVQVRIFNPLTEQYQSFSALFDSSATAENGCVTVSFADDFELNNPLACAVRGVLLDSNDQGIASRPVQIFSDNYYKFAITKADGRFAAAVPCDQVVSINASLGDTAIVKTVNANNTLDEDEVSDTGIFVGEPPLAVGSIAQVEFTVPNEPPVILGATYPDLVLYDVAQGATVVDVMVSTFDADGDAVQVDVVCSPEESSVVAANLAQASVPCSVDQGGIWQLDISADDGVNDPVTSTKFMQVFETNSNRAPVFLAVDKGTTALNCVKVRPGEFGCKARALSGDVLNFTAKVYDPDGDTLTYSWSNGGATMTASFDTSVDTSPLVLTVDDGNGGQLKVSIAVEVQSVPAPQIQFMFVDPPEVQINSAGLNAIAIYAEAFAKNPIIDDPSISYSWTLEMLDTSSATGALIDMSELLTDASQEGSLISAVTIAAGSVEVGFYQLTVTVTDERQASVEKSIVFTVKQTDDPVANPVIIIE